MKLTKKRKDKLITELGTVPDVMLAKKYGVSSTSLHFIRKARGIAPYKGKVLKGVRNRKMRGEDGSTRKKMLSQLGKKPDNQIARAFGLSRERIRVLRNERGITKYQG
ncbi:hypothetical protein KAR91_88410 [Candidatus Pacearchaeota archaeon]|nr:hypothetical protein [Candidatus Pacearchaeota archaeon]